jgi:hypothetical protein
MVFIISNCNNITLIVRILIAKIEEACHTPSDFLLMRRSFVGLEKTHIKLLSVCLSEKTLLRLQTTWKVLVVACICLRLLKSSPCLVLLNSSYKDMTYILKQIMLATFISICQKFYDIINTAYIQKFNMITGYAYWRFTSSLIWNIKLLSNCQNKSVFVILLTEN